MYFSRSILIFVCALLPLTGGATEQVLRSFEQASRDFFPAADKYKASEATLSEPGQKALAALLGPFQGRGGHMTPQGTYAMMEASFKGKPPGTVVRVEEIGKHKPISFAIGIQADGTVQGVAVLTYRENYGIQIKDPKFLGQYRGKRWSDKLATPGDIDAVSGATYSSYAANRAVRKALAVLKVLGKVPGP
jgi:transcriptional regulator of nitric oxide reductase